MVYGLSLGLLGKWWTQRRIHQTALRKNSIQSEAGLPQVQVKTLCLSARSNPGWGTRSDELCKLKKKTEDEHPTTYLQSQVHALLKRFPWCQCRLSRAAVIQDQPSLFQQDPRRTWFWVSEASPGATRFAFNRGHSWSDSSQLKSSPAPCPLLPVTPSKCLPS